MYAIRSYYGLLFPAEATVEIAIAGLQQLPEAFRTAQRIGTFEKAGDRPGAHFRPPADVAVVARHQHGEVAALGGRLEVSAHFLDKFDASRLVAGMPGQILRRRRALAEIVQQYGEANGLV